MNGIQREVRNSLIGVFIAGAIVAAILIALALFLAHHFRLHWI